MITDIYAIKETLENLGTVSLSVSLERDVRHRPPRAGPRRRSPEREQSGGRRGAVGGGARRVR